jgi:hypothetical protein
MSSESSALRADTRRRIRSALARSMVVGAIVVGAATASLFWFENAAAPGPEPIYDLRYVVGHYGPIGLYVAFIFLAPLPVAAWFRRRLRRPRWLERLDRLFEARNVEGQTTERDRVVAEFSVEAVVAAFMAGTLNATIPLAVSLGRMPVTDWIQIALVTLIGAPFVFGVAAIWYLSVECWFLRRALITP